MKLIVLGATGATGREVVNQALAAGHQVTAFGRSSGELPVDAPGFSFVAGQPATDSKALTAAAAGHDAIISTLGNRGLGATTLIEDSTDVIIEAAAASGVDRVLVMSALGVGSSAELTTGATRLIGGRMLRKVFADKAAGEKKLKESGVRWTIAYPTVLTNKPARGVYRATELESTPKTKGSIARADVAAFLLAEAASGAFVNKTVVITD